MNGKKQAYIGVDIGGTNIVCGLISADGGEPIRLHKMATGASDGGDRIMERLAEGIRELAASEPDWLVEAVGIGLPGFVDHEQGISVVTVNLGWRDYPVASLLSEKLGGLPVYINNDVRMYIYGEAVAGAASGAKYVLGLTIGTGLAAAYVSEGKLHYGSGNRAGELGHITYPEIPYRCNCGLQGCLETIVSATGIARQTKDAIGRGEPSVLAERFAGDKLQSLTAADVSQAYDEGDELAKRVMEFTGTMLGKGLGAAITLYSPDAVIVGGGGARAGDRLLEPMWAELRRSVLPMYLDGLRIVTAGRIEDAGVIGSALYAKDRLRNGDFN